MMKYEDLIVWQKGILLVKEIYQKTKKFPPDERFGLISQMRRSAVSIPSNIAEGHGRKSTQAYINHLSIAFGSLMELETLLKISNELRLKNTLHCKAMFIPSIHNPHSSILYGIVKKISR